MSCPPLVFWKVSMKASLGSEGTILADAWRCGNANIPDNHALEYSKLEKLKIIICIINFNKQPLTNIRMIELHWKNKRTYLRKCKSVTSFIHSQQNSAPQTAHCMWLQEPSSILPISTWHRGQGFTSSPGIENTCYLKNKNNSDSRKLANVGCRNVWVLTKSGVVTEGVRCWLCIWWPQSTGCITSLIRMPLCLTVVAEIGITTLSSTFYLWAASTASGYYGKTSK